MQIFIGRDGQQFGPYTIGQVNALLVSGHILPIDLAWHEGASKWAPLTEIKDVGITMAPAVSPPPLVPLATPAPNIRASLRTDLPTNCESSAALDSNTRRDQLVSDMTPNANMNEMQDQGLSFITGELTFFQKLLQVYWINPKSWLLDRLESDGKTITIRRRNGAVDTIQPSAFRCTFGTDNYGRREFKIQTTDGRKIRFKEIPGMLAEPEWDAIAELLGATESDWNKVLHAVRAVVTRAKHH